MSTTSKSPRKVLLAAYRVGQQTLPQYSHRFSPRKFTLPQLFSCLVLKSFLKADYRGVVEFLVDCPALRESIELDHVPHYTTLQKACRRLIRLPKVEQLLHESLKVKSPRRRRVKLAAIDSTGFESGYCSRYFVRRRSRVENLWQTTTYKRFPKLGVICDVSTHMVISIHLGRGPTPDVAQLKDPARKACQGISIGTLLADAGYDSESNHQFCRHDLGVRTLIPPRHGRPTAKPAGGRYRRLMQTRFNQSVYGQRWQVETVFSMIKRRQGDSTSGRSYYSRRRDMMLLAITHNIMILYDSAPFLQSSPDPFFDFSAKTFASLKALTEIIRT
jgi:transposase